MKQSNFFDEANNIFWTHCIKQSLQVGHIKVVTATITKIVAVNQNVFNGQWTLTWYTLRLVLTF